MQHPRICVAGIEVDSKQHLRPVTASALPLSRALLAEAGGPFQIGAGIELGETQPRPDPPETEDHLCDPGQVEALGRLSGEEYLDLLDRISHPTLLAAFGPDLKRRSKTFAVQAGHGSCSLACIHARRRADLNLDRYGAIRLRFNDPYTSAAIKVADLRFYEEDQVTPREDLIVSVSQRLQRGVGLWVMFGLARAWKAKGDDVERHWLQVNGLCLEDSPLELMP